MLYYFIGYLSLICAKLFFRLEVHGYENFPRKGGIIIASNHLSLLDPVIIGAACLLRLRKIEYMAKEELFKVPVLGSVISRVNAFPVGRNRRDIAAVKEAIRRLSDGKALLLFPEGSRSAEGAVLNARSGVGLLARRANVPILPVLIKGTDKAMPKGSRFIRPKKVSVHFGKLYYADGNISSEQITQDVMQRIMFMNSNLKTVQN